MFIRAHPYDDILPISLHARRHMSGNWEITSRAPSAPEPCRSPSTTRAPPSPADTPIAPDRPRSPPSAPDRPRAPPSPADPRAPPSAPDRRSEPPSAPDRPRSPPSAPERPRALPIPECPQVEHPARARPSLPIPERAISSRRRRLVCRISTRGARGARTRSSYIIAPPFPFVLRPIPPWPSLTGRSLTFQRRRRIPESSGQDPPLCSRRTRSRHACTPSDSFGTRWA